VNVTSNKSNPNKATSGGSTIMQKTREREREGERVHNTNSDMEAFMNEIIRQLL